MRGGCGGVCVCVAGGVIELWSPQTVRQWGMCRLGASFHTLGLFLFSCLKKSAERFTYLCARYLKHIQTQQKRSDIVPGRGDQGSQ